MMGKVLNVLRVIICFVGLGLGCVVELFWWFMRGKGVTPRGDGKAVLGLTFVMEEEFYMGNVSRVRINTW
jgi:hypothetical protein